MTTYDPDRRFRLDAGPEGVSLSPDAPSLLPSGSAVLRLPAEALTEPIRAVRALFGTSLIAPLT